MSSAGSILDMIQRVRNNSNLLKKSRYFNKAQKEYSEYKTQLNVDTKATPEQLETIRAKAKENSKQSLKTGIKALMVSLIITIVLAILFLNLLSE